MEATRPGSSERLSFWTKVGFAIGDFGPAVGPGTIIPFFCVGTEATLATALRCARAGARVMLVGVKLAPMKLDLTPVWYEEVDLRGFHAHGVEEWEGDRLSSYERVVKWLEECAGHLRTQKAGERGPSQLTCKEDIMAEQQRGVKEEKEERSWDEKWRRDPLSALVWAGILIWAGLVLFAENLGLLVRYEPLEAWSLIFIGAGLIVLLEVVVRLLVPDYRRPVTGTLIFAIILVGIGLGDWVGWGAIWPLVLIALGASILLRGIIGQR